LLLVVDLTQDPVAQAEALIARLNEKRIVIGQDTGITDEDAPVNYKKALIVGNKSDLDYGGVNYRALKYRYGERVPVIAISAIGQELDTLRQNIYQMLDIIRVYTKTPGGKPDMTDPIILDRGGTMEDAAISVHKDFGKKMKYARIWGSGKFDGVMVKRDHVLLDGDIIELHA
jgi:ribosome-interacting GTPase 1